MTIRFVGVGGNNGNDGLSWATRKLTLNGVEDTPVVAGDEVRVGPGTYREQLTCDVSGTAGSPITYIGDEGGTLTDGIGGEVRITGSDNDQTATRASAVVGSSINYRTFRGFHVDTVSSLLFSITSGTDWIIEQCVGNGAAFVQISGALSANCIIRRCLSFGAAATAIAFAHSSTLSNTNHLLENFAIVGVAGTTGVTVTRVGGVTVRNGLIIGVGGTAIFIAAALAVGQILTVNNTLITGCGVAIRGQAVAEIVEDYNNLFGNTTARISVNVGANSTAYSPLLSMPLLTLGIHTWLFGSLSAASALKALAGTSVPAEDLFGTTRAAPSSWAAVQYEATRRPNDSGSSRGRTQ